MIQPNFTTKKVDQTQNSGTFIMEPLSPSFGESIGNALRRTLLSSLKGSAVTAVKIDGVSHLFSSLKGVKETPLELTLNLKQVRFTVPSDGTLKVNISKKGVGKVYGKDIEGEAVVVNKDAYIGEITDAKGKLEIEALIESGTGYVSVEEQTAHEFGFIPIDSSFSPVRKVSYHVEDARVGRKTNFDRLIMTIETDGSISPEEALQQAVAILTEQLAYILKKEETVVPKQDGTQSNLPSGEIDKKFYDLIIDELNLPSRVVNALLRENIETVADLIKTGEDKLVVFKGLGRKSIDLIKEELKKLGVDWK